jgi:hypothetical protein
MTAYEARRAVEDRIGYFRCTAVGLLLARFFRGRHAANTEAI